VTAPGAKSAISDCILSSGAIQIANNVVVKSTHVAAKSTADSGVTKKTKKSKKELS